MGEKTNEHRPGEGCYYLLCGISERDGYSILTLAHKSGIVLARYDGSRRSEYYNCPSTVGETVYAKLVPEESEDADYAVVNILPGEQAHCPYGDGDFAVRVKRQQPASDNETADPKNKSEKALKNDSDKKAANASENVHGAVGSADKNAAAENDAVPAMSEGVTDAPSAVAAAAAAEKKEREAYLPIYLWTESSRFRCCCSAGWKSRAQRDRTTMLRCRIRAAR